MNRVILPMAVVLLLLSFGSLSAQVAPEFRLGFSALASQIPDIAGQPLEDEHYGATGDSLQRTTTGLMVWRKADNWTAFTNGSTTWVNGPYGVQERGNDDRFPFEADDRTQPPPPPQSPPAPRPASTSAGRYPRVNVRPVGTNWEAAAIFWSGRATEHDNYLDVRVSYDDQALYLYGAVTDYYLWNERDGRGDPRQYDALALYLDTGGSAGLLGSDDYLFVSGFRGSPVENDARWHRQARGGPSGWDYSWDPSPAWKDLIGLRYYNSGPNSNTDRDGGWATTFTIPWATLGLASPPAPGALWRMGVQLYDRDEGPPAPLVGTTSWPSAFSENVPDSWGTVAFNPPAYASPNLPEAGNSLIRRGLPGAVVKDAYAGGGGGCGGGVFGGGDKPHPTDELFVQNQSDIADFPCFSKSYLSFDLSRIPPGRKILSASLTLHEFGGSDPTQAKPSQVQLLTVEGDWQEENLTWNNAPLARENISVSRVDVLPSFPGWPGVPFRWDATKAVAEAYAAGQPANLALYSADSAYHSGKYFVSSDTGDWNAVARPTLAVSWAD